MPLYEARNIEHPEIRIQFAPMPWAEFKAFLDEHPGYEQVMNAPAFVRVN